MNTKAKGSRIIYYKEVICVECGVKFITRRHSKAKFHSHICYGKYRTKTFFGSNHHSWRGGQNEYCCVNCGVQFFRYKTVGGIDRKFCSWQCSNKHKGLVISMRARFQYERELFHKLENEGYFCIRSAGSRGAFDIIAMNKKVVRFIQVKSTKNFERTGNTEMFMSALEELAKHEYPPHSTKELWVRVLRKGWKYVVLNIIPKTRPELRTLVKNLKWKILY